MTFSDRCLALVKEAEGFRPDAYRCPAGVWTIGWGTTRNVKPGMTATPAAAEVWLREDLQQAAAEVQRLITAPLTQEQLDALTSFTYNLGAGALQKSTLRKLLNAGNVAAAADEFPKWINSNGKPLDGLRRRRANERTLFLSSAPQLSSTATNNRPEGKTTT